MCWYGSNIYVRASGDIAHKHDIGLFSGDKHLYIKVQQKEMEVALTKIVMCDKGCDPTAYAQSRQA